jgi:hypothetical protein
MERFIHRLNIVHYEKLLQIVIDEAERKRILNLLEEERTKSNLDSPPEKKETVGIGCKRDRALG